MYKSLVKGTVHHWIKAEGGWSKEILQKVAAAKSRILVARQGRPKILSKYPQVIKATISHIEFIHASGVSVSQPLVQSLLMGFISELAPDLNGFKCSGAFVDRFLSQTMGWSYRAVTQAAQKRPEDWEPQCNDAFLRITYSIKWDCVPPEFIINADQTGVSLLPTNK